MLREPPCIYRLYYIVYWWTLFVKCWRMGSNLAENRTFNRICWSITNSEHSDKRITAITNSVTYTVTVLIPLIWTASISPISGYATSVVMDALKWRSILELCHQQNLCLGNPNFVVSVKYILSLSNPLWSNQGCWRF